MRMLTKGHIEQYLAEMDAELAGAGLTGEIVPARLHRQHLTDARFHDQPVRHPARLTKQSVPLLPIYGIVSA